MAALRSCLLQGRSVRLGSDSTLSQQGAQPHTLGACWGSRRHWPWDCPGKVRGVAWLAVAWDHRWRLRGRRLPTWSGTRRSFDTRQSFRSRRVVHFSEASQGKIGIASGRRERRLVPLYPGPGAAGGPSWCCRVWAWGRGGCGL